MKRSTRALLNGESDLGGLVASRGLHYGDGVFRTLLRFDSRWLQWGRQMQKLREDAAAIDLDAPSPDLLLREAEQITADQSTAVLKIMLMRAGAGRGYRSEARHVDRLLIAFDATYYSSAHWSRGIAAFRSTVPLAEQPRLAGIKHLNRLEQVLASRDWPQGMDEGICCSAEAAPICGTRSNVFWARDGRLFTPELRHCGVAGVMRQAIIDNARDMNIDTQIVRADWSELAGADEAFVSNSLIGLWPLRTLDGIAFSQAPGPLTQLLSQALAHPRLAIESP